MITYDRIDHYESLINASYHQLTYKSSSFVYICDKSSKAVKLFFAHRIITANPTTFRSFEMGCSVTSRVYLMCQYVEHVPTCLDM